MIDRAELCEILDRFGREIDYEGDRVSFPVEAWRQLSTDMRWIPPLPWLIIDGERHV
jgi:hypothetical protein